MSAKIIWVLACLIEILLIKGHVNPQWQQQFCPRQNRKSTNASLFCCSAHKTAKTWLHLTFPGRVYWAVWSLIIDEYTINIFYDLSLQWLPCFGTFICNYHFRLFWIRFLAATYLLALVSKVFTSISSTGRRTVVCVIPSSAVISPSLRVHVPWFCMLWLTPLCLHSELWPCSHRSGPSGLET